jgi:hypothetical protein
MIGKDEDRTKTERDITHQAERTANPWDIYQQSTT